MSSVRIRIAHALGRHLVQVMPATRTDWAAGMKAEIEAIDAPGAALAFALGCVRAGYARRLRTVPGAIAAAQALVGAATIAFSMLVLANAGWSMALKTPAFLPQIFGGLGLAFLVAGVALLRAGPTALAGIAATMLTLNTIALWVSAHAGHRYADIHHALIIEGYVMWSALLLTGLSLGYAARSPRLAAFARARGWEA